MKKFSKLFLIFFGIVFVTSSCTTNKSSYNLTSDSAALTSKSEKGSGLKSKNKYKNKNKSSLKTPDFEKIKLENGIIVYFLVDKSLPQFSIQGILSKGSAQDFKGQAGLASMTMAMLKEGSGDLNSELYKAEYSKFSSEFDYDVEKDSIVFKSTGLTKYNKNIVNLFLDTMFKPHLLNTSKVKDLENEFKKIKDKRLAQIEKSTEQAAYYANISFQSILFKNENYAFPEIGTKSNLQKLKLIDLQKYYTTYIQPESLQFALTGHFSAATKNELIQKLKNIRSHSDLLKKGPVSKLPQKLVVEKTEDTLINTTEPSVVVKPVVSTKIIVVDKPNLKQAEVRIGHIGPKRDYAYFIPLYISNSAVGSGDFNSMLMQEIRVKRGLVYGVNSVFAGLKENGYFLVSASTRHDKVDELIKTILDIIKNVKNVGIKSEDLETQRGILLGQFPMKFETEDNFMNQIMRYKNYGFDENYIQNFYQQIQDLDLTQANSILKTNYKPDESLIVIFASKKELPKGLSKLGYPIEYIDYKKILP